MACNCGRNRAQFEVVTGEGEELKVLHTSPSKVAAEQLAARYPGATVRPKPAPVPATRNPARPAPRQAPARAADRAGVRGRPTPRDVRNARARRDQGRPGQDG